MRGNKAARLAGHLALGAALLLAGAGLRAAEVRVRGLGLLQDRQAQRTLTLLLGPQLGATLDAGAIEDAALILYSKLGDEGYLQAAVTAQVTRTDGSRGSYPIESTLEHPLPRPLAATAVTLRIRHGVRYSLRAVEFHGLTALPAAEARAYFIGGTILFPLASERIYSPGRLQSAVGNLQEDLRRRGFAEAALAVADLRVDPKSGQARVRIDVRQGPAWEVTALTFNIADGSPAPDELVRGRVNHPWSDLWRQDTMAAIRRWYDGRGHPDVAVKLTPRAAPPIDNRRAVSVTAEITPNPQVRLGRVRIIGNAHTREPMLRRLIHAKPGEPLNPADFDDAEARLARLGVFSNIALRYDPPDGPARDAVFQVTEGRRQEVDLLGGWGSYEELRGGVEWRHYNLLGLANTDDLKLVQSVKSTQLDYTYTVPELFGTSVDGSARLFGFRREELAFVRTEYGANVSLLWPLRGLGGNLTTGYTFDRLGNTSNTLATSPTDLNQVNAASVNIGLTSDTRDNPLVPRRGRKLFIQLAEASRRLGGQVEYQQLTFGGSYHRPVGGGHWIHVGFAQGIVTTLGAASDAQLPVNVRFFPGGDSSIRGYRDGGAAPRAANGQFVGAKTYTQLNVEFEQALTSKWSAVVFGDALGTAARLADYPFSERLYTVGLGLNYQTLIGPVRIEYGHNLNPRPQDPSGTLLLSIGFPF